MPPPSRSPFSPIPQRERERGGRHTEEPIPVRETSVDSEDTSRRSQRGVDLPDRACSVASEQEEEDKQKQALLGKKLEVAKEDLQKQKAGEGGKDDESGSDHLITHIPSEIQPAQRASSDGLFCPLWGKSGCRKWLSSARAFKQHLCSKHDIPRDQAARVADGQWKNLPSRSEASQEPHRRNRPNVSLVPRDERNPKVPRSEPSEGSQASSSQQDAGIQLLRQMWADVADRVLKK